MVKKPIIIIVSIVAALILGSAFGYGYYYITYGSNVVSANPLDKSDPKPPPKIPGQSEENQKEYQAEEEKDPGEVNEEKGNWESNIPENNTPDVEGRTGNENAGNGGTPPINGTGKDIIGGEAGETNKKAEKVAYITIDDGPDPNNTPAILKVLEEFDIKATFFVLGVFAEKHPELIQQIYEAGHAIGNHTYNHRYNETYASDKSFWDSVKKTEDIVYDIIGERINLIREPGGRFMTDPKKQEMVRGQGYGLIHWNVDSYDSRSPIPDADTIFSNVKRQTEKEKLWPAMVILIHEGGDRGSTVDALPRILQHLSDEGFVFKSLKEMDAEAMAELPRP